jgi:hypothetical protein
MGIDYIKLCDNIWGDINSETPITTPEKLLKARVAIQAFLKQPNTPEFRKKLQAYQNKKIQALGYTVSTDFVDTANQSFNAFFEQAEYDMGWENYFKLVPVSPYKRSWEIHTVKNGLAFKKLKEGETVEIYGLNSDKDIISCDKYGGAMGWSDELIRFREVAAMADIAETFRNRYHENKASNHYVLIYNAAKLHPIAYQGAVADGRLRRDIDTLNQGVYQLGKINKGKGYAGNMSRPNVLLTADPIFMGRIEAAIRATTANMAPALAGGTEVNYPIQRQYTFDSNFEGKIIMGIPGNKSQRADILAPTQFTDTNILNLTYIQAVYSYYGAGIGDTEQFVELKFS